MRKKMWILILAVSILVFVVAAVRLYLLTRDYREGDTEYETVQREVLSEPENPDDKTPEATEFRVDFEKLRKRNPEVVGWIRFDEPEIISYPIVQTTDNQTYLTKTVNGSTNKVGSIFMDMNNDAGFADSNTFIYGHNMKDGSMFGKLRKYKKESFYKKYPYFYIYTPDGRVQTYEIFSVEIAEDTSKSFTNLFVSDEEYLSYLSYVKARALYATEIFADASSQMVSLSTCTNVREEERLIVHGIKKREETLKAGE